MPRTLCMMTTETLPSGARILRTVAALSLPLCRYEAVQVARRGTRWELVRRGETGQRVLLAYSAAPMRSREFPFVVTEMGRALGLTGFTMRAVDFE